MYPPPPPGCQHVLDPFGAEAAILLCVPILVLITELVEMSIKDLMELILAARNIPRAGYLPNRDWDCHNLHYGRNLVVYSLSGRFRERRTAGAGRVLCELNLAPPTVVVAADGPIDLCPRCHPRPRLARQLRPM